MSKPLIRYAFASILLYYRDRIMIMNESQELVKLSLFPPLASLVWFRYSRERMVEVELDAHQIDFPRMEGRHLLGKQDEVVSESFCP